MNALASKASCPTLHLSPRQRKRKIAVDASTTTMFGAFNDKNAFELRKRSTTQNSSSSETIPAATVEQGPRRDDATPNDDADVIWGKTPSGKGTSVRPRTCTSLISPRKDFKVPTTHHTLTLVDPRYPKSHFDLMNLALLISQVALFLLWPRSFSRRFFFFSFIFWRAAYNAGLGWILTKQSKRKWIVREVSQRGWLDESKRPKVRAWIRKQLSVKMGRDYDFDVSSHSSLGGLVCAWPVGDAWGHPHLGWDRKAFHEAQVDTVRGASTGFECTQVYLTPFNAVGHAVAAPIGLRQTRSTNMGLTRACSRAPRNSQQNTIHGSSSVK